MYSFCITKASFNDKENLNYTSEEDKSHASELTDTHMTLRQFVPSQSGSYLSFSACRQSSSEFPSLKGENI